MKRRILAILCTIMILMVASIGSALAETNLKGQDIEQAAVEKIKETAPLLISKIPQPGFGSVGGEWAMIGLARSDERVPTAYIEGYYDRVVTILKETEGVLHKVKYTEYSRLILALTALEKDVQNVGGYNLLTYLADFDTLIKQGINGPIFALLALDSKAYEVPAVPGIETQTTRQKLIDYILEKECITQDGTRGGFSLGAGAAQIDITAMALQALSKYKDQPDVAAAVSRGIKTLERLEQEEQAFTLWNESTAESAAQVIVAKAALDLDPTENVSQLLDYAVEGGGFSHDGNQGFDLMATEQGFYALVSYERYLKGKPALYDMWDVDGQVPAAGIENQTASDESSAKEDTDEIKVLLNGNKLEFEQAPVNIGGRVFVPMRAIFEALDANVSWDGQTRTVTGKTQDHVVILTIGESQAILNGQTMELDAPAQIIGGYTMVPVRFIAESLEAKVDWDGWHKTVLVEKKTVLVEK